MIPFFSHLFTFTMPVDRRHLSDFKVQNSVVLYGGFENLSLPCSGLTAFIHWWRGANLIYMWRLKSSRVVVMLSQSQFRLPGADLCKFLLQQKLEKGPPLTNKSVNLWINKKSDYLKFHFTTVHSKSLGVNVKVYDVPATDHIVQPRHTIHIISDNMEILLPADISIYIKEYNFILKKKTQKISTHSCQCSSASRNAASVCVSSQIWLTGRPHV